LQVFIDANGDAEGNYTVVALLDDESVNGSLRMSMQTVAYFQYTPNASSNPHDLPVSLYIVVTSILYNCIFILNCVIECYSFRKKKLTLNSCCSNYEFYFVWNVIAMEILSLGKKQRNKKLIYLL
jgi:hypothetical protein